MKTVIVFAALLFVSPVLAAEAAPPPPAVQQQFPVSLTYQEWAQVVGSVRRSDNLSARDADAIVNRIAQQVAADQKQGAANQPGRK